MNISRRDFLGGTLSGVTLAAAGASLPLVLARTARAASRVDPNGRILVLVQLTGGNDGLNTVIPHRDDLYYRLRPTLAVKRGQALAISDEISLHPQLAALRELFDEGRLGVVQGVGYPNPNRSHFESMDIWHTADPTLAARETGWLGRALEHAGDLHALQIDDQPLPLALRAERTDVPSVSSLDSFRLRGGADSPAVRAVEALLAAGAQASAACAPAAGAGDGAHALAGARTPGAQLVAHGVAHAPAVADDIQFVRRTAVSACENARRLAALPPDRAGGYPGYGLARRLHDIARLIVADLGPRIFYTSLGGFDTHARQNTVQPALLGELAQSVRAFFDDLDQHNLAERVLLMTFSEFGRRAAENASLGTDHGAAAPLFVAGAGVQGGVHGPRPDLTNLADGDVSHAIDFRAVYASVLEDWLRVPSAAVLGNDFAKMGILR